MNFSNWKTMLGGLLTAGMGAASLFGVKVGNTPIDPVTSMGMITGGLGLAFAKDYNVTGGNVKQDVGPVTTDATKPRGF